MNIVAPIVHPDIAVGVDDVSVSVTAPGVGIAVADQRIIVSSTSPAVEISTGEQIARDTGDIPIYHGVYEVTPTNEEQTLDTQGYYLAENIILKPIPSNYGLITWSGSILTVS